MTRTWVTVGEALRRARDLRGWTQADLAQEIGISRPQIANIERDSSHPSVQVIEAICKAFRCKLTCGPRGWKLA